MSAARAASIRGAGFGSMPKFMRARDYGLTLPSAECLHGGDNGVRQQVLLQTLSRLEEASSDARYHRLAQANLARWAKDAHPSPPPAGSCTVRVLPGDFLATTGRLPSGRLLGSSAKSKFSASGLWT